MPINFLQKRSIDLARESAAMFKEMLKQIEWDSEVEDGTAIATARFNALDEAER